jgi:hypothetical protein
MNQQSEDILLESTENITIYMRFLNSINELKLLGLIEEYINNNV